MLFLREKIEFGACSFWGRWQDVGMGKDLRSHPWLSLRFAAGLDLALGKHLVGMDVCFRRSITMMHAGSNDVRWEKRSRKGGPNPGAAGSAKVCFESSRLPGSSVRRKPEKKEGASLHIHRFLGPSPPAVLGGSAHSRAAWPPEFGGIFAAGMPRVTP